MKVEGSSLSISPAPHHRRPPSLMARGVLQPQRAPSHEPERAHERPRGGRGVHRARTPAVRWGRTCCRGARAGRARGGGGGRGRGGGGGEVGGGVRVVARLLAGAEVGRAGAVAVDVVDASARSEKWKGGKGGKEGRGERETHKSRWTPASEFMIA